MDRDRLQRWEKAYRCFDRTWYYELLAATLARRWERAGGVIGFVVAVTSSGSTVTAWQLWKTEWGTILWSVIAGTASVLAIAQAQLRVPARVLKHRRLRRKYGLVRRAIQGILQDILDGHDLAKIDKELRAEIRKYDNLAASVDPDLAETRRLRRLVRADTDNAMEDEGFFAAGILKEEEPGALSETVG